MKDGSFDLMHTHGHFADVCGLSVAKLLGIPGISTCHGYIKPTDTKLRVYTWLDKLFLRLCDRVIVVSSEIKIDLARNGIDESRIVFIQNAVPRTYDQKEVDDNRNKKRELLSLKQQEILIGYTGRLSEEKGVRYLIEAGSLLKKNIKNFRIVILGDGLERKELEKLVKLNDLEKEINFVGFQSDVERWLPALDIFVLPSLTEGTPLSLLEAMSLGVPVVATAVGGVPSVVEDGINGFLVNPGNVQEINEKIGFLIKNPEVRYKIAKGAMNTIKTKFDVHEWCKKIENVYDILLANNLMQ
jgi:glycosyltransferase involved in cell wall biosynthesis